MKNYYFYEWQSFHKESRDIDFSNNLSELIQENLSNTLINYEITLVRNKVINDELAFNEYADISDNENLSLKFDETGYPVPKKYINQFNKIKNQIS
tara:strand:+ start:726 stop:1013 length:288 start_codon:yes stop_codon:yes gene_type:complete